MAEGQDLSKMDASEIDIAEDESDGQKSPTSRRKKVKKVSIVKSKKQTDKRFDWPKKSYFEILCQEGNEMVRINGCWVNLFSRASLEINVCVLIILPVMNCALISFTEKSCT